MKRLALPLIALAVLTPSLSQAHDPWMVPSATVLSGEHAWVTVDTAVGNDKFEFNHRPLQLKALEIAGPDGKKVQAQNEFSGRLRSGFDVQLAEAGTYRIAVVNNGIMARWKEDGKMKRWFGSAQDFAAKVPANAPELDVRERASRVETFVTKGEPSALSDVKDGIALKAVTHPNDLFAGENAKFILTIDGQPAKQVAVQIVPEGSRYRDALNAIDLKTDDKGAFNVTWPGAGKYWLHAASTDQKTTVPQAQKRSLSYSATLEVLPQ